MAEQPPNNTNITNTDNSDDENPNPNPNPNPNSIAINNGIPSTPIVCLFKFASDSAGGAAVGAFFGFGLGLFKKKGFKGSLADSANNAKAFAVLSGVHSFVSCLLRKIRGKDDVINAGLAGCCTGVALTYPGPPAALLQSCLTFGGFSFAMDFLNKKQPALAHSSNSRESHSSPAAITAIPPLALPLSDELMGPFMAFCQLLRQSKKRNGPSAA